MWKEICCSKAGLLRSEWQCVPEDFVKRVKLTLLKEEMMSVLQEPRGTWCITNLFRIWWIFPVWVRLQKRCHRPNKLRRWEEVHPVSGKRVPLRKWQFANSGGSEQRSEIVFSLRNTFFQNIEKEYVRIEILSNLSCFVYLLSGLVKYLASWFSYLDFIQKSHVYRGLPFVKNFTDINSRYWWS